jgi:hypothetical protein
MVTNLSVGAKFRSLLGPVWFNVKGHNVRIENYPAEIAIFESGGDRYFKPVISRDSGKTVVDYAGGLSR